jgi:hypothetical protein
MFNQSLLCAVLKTTIATFLPQAVLKKEKKS